MDFILGIKMSLLLSWACETKVWKTCVSVELMVPQIQSLWFFSLPLLWTTFFFFFLFSACLHLFRAESCSRMFPLTMYRNTPYMRNTCLKGSFSLPRSLGKSKVLEKGQPVSRREMRGEVGLERGMINGKRTFGTSLGTWSHCKGSLFVYLLIYFGSLFFPLLLAMN